MTQNETSFQKRREIVIVAGVTGAGKTEWCKRFTRAFSRLAVYDVMQDFPVQYMARENVVDVAESKPEQFRIGVYSPYDVDVLTSAAFVMGNCWLVLEEISTLYNIGARIKGPLQEAILIGRHRALSLLVITQRPAYIPITIRSQVSRVISFRQQEPADVEFMQSFYGKSARDLQSLPDYECMDWERGNFVRYSTYDSTLT